LSLSALVSAIAADPIGSLPDLQDATGQVPFALIESVCDSIGLADRFLSDYGTIAEWNYPENGPTGIDVGEFLVWLLETKITA
jgi:hypothetical protein